MKTRIVSTLIIIVLMFIILAPSFQGEGNHEKSIEKTITDEIHREVLEIIRENSTEGNTSGTTKKQEFAGNRVGYSVYNGQTSRHYRKDLLYLVEEEYVGKGIFVSEYISESEVFLGRVLQQTIEQRGKIDSELSSYFTHYAREQLLEVDWELLKENWRCQPYDYFRYYTLTYPYGELHYQFYYGFFADLEKTKSNDGMINEVWVEPLVNGNGQIYYIDIRISAVSPEKTGTANYIITDPLCDDLYAEKVIESGRQRTGLLFDFESYYRRFMYPGEEYVEELGGFWQTGDMAVGATQLKEVLVDMLESQGSAGSKYETWGEEFFFSFDDFLNVDWQAVGKGWVADGEYDCICFDEVKELGYVKLEYYFYPDFSAMNTDEAMAAIVRGNLGVSDGELYYVNVSVFPITKEEYEEITEKKEKENRKVLLVDQGKMLTGKAAVNIPIPVDTLKPVPIWEYEIQPLETGYIRERKNELWGYTDMVVVADELAGLFYQDMQEKQTLDGRVYSLLTEEAKDWSLMLIKDFEETGWKMGEAYDCYYISENEVAGTLHLQYYFYPKDILQEGIYKKVLVIDVYLSEAGIEEIKSNQIRIIR